MQWLEDLASDLRYAARAFRRNPGFAADRHLLPRARNRREYSDFQYHHQLSVQPAFLP